MRYVVEVINSCCFQHGDEDILKRFSNKREAQGFVKSIQRMSIKGVKRLKLDSVFITGIRIVDTVKYPPETIYETHSQEYMYELENKDVPTWRDI